ncbi:hypothetical protein KC332_g2725 [Hortaea werneckii]|nr:hypothetical protein KC358_g5164 [Hortaea werneckii]KAI6845473.1 hypothetical protein KC350_g4424 [Hortaea werneckii]KAI6938123.1 hypothetical protein KC348_g5550 [Hortaea werneckii]KAI6938139.1 hypothetical protein KC341_g5104 [Hortaea werneckii]KAI6973733.1 hypothetical protein KC321_g5496 [Hortaea werneckii]
MAQRTSPSDEQHLSITAVEQVASYNWLDSTEPTLLVPGSPPIWSPPDAPVQVPPDTGRFFIDPNAGMMPTSPMEPLFRAVLHEHPTFDFSSLDLITDRWALSRLLSDNDSWSLAAEVVKGKVIFIRLEPEKEIEIQPHQFRGFRRNFEKESLKYREDCRGSRAHYQIITYSLGEMNILLRHAAAGYFAGDLTAHSPIDADEAPHTTTLGDTTTAPTAVQQHGKIRIRSAGARIPRSAIFELSTSKKVGTLEGYKQHEVPEQWIAQTQGYIRALAAETKGERQAWKRHGTFSEESVDIRRNACADTAEWEGENQGRIQRLHRRLADILLCLRRACQASGSGYFILESEGKGGTLNLREVGANEVRGLPRDLIERLGRA